MAHGFVLSMGGFYYTEIESIAPLPSSSSTILPDRAPLSGTVKLSILDLHDLRSHPHLAKKLEEGSAETIEDKSKGDTLSKMFSILQISWFIVQCIAQALQHLPITLLEVTALAFAGLSIITYCLWWNKPLNVKYHISLDGSDLRTSTLALDIRYVHYLWIDQVKHSLMMFHHTILCTFGVGNVEHKNVMGSGNYRLSSGSQYKPLIRLVIIVCVGLLFGTFHCTAWSFSFPSHTEMVLWRFSSFAVLIGWTLKVAFIHIHSRMIYRALNASLVYILVVGVFAYIIAWIILIILAFMQLRSLSPLAFHTIQWMTYISHI
ncbi:hypothetical protein EDD85DRAFT_914131 [Armillaria nabsnona]|nr:hypothetical protein EDD85DRAFT_914131 [Armillaria nabsnona]